MLRRTLSVLLSAVMLAVMLPISSMAASAPFTDVADSDWFSKAVTQMYDSGYMAGTSATTFSPNDPTDRAMFVTILGRIQGVDKEAYKGKAAFTDVKTGWDWAEPYIAWAAEQGITSGTGSNLFEPGRNVTRQEAASLLFRFLRKVGGCDMTADPALLEAFGDAETVDDFAKAGMEWAVTTKVFNGKDGNLIDPKGNATRAEIAQIFTTFLRACNSTAFEAGVSVAKDENSPTGYTARFVYKSTDADLASVSVTGAFRYATGDETNIKDEGNAYTPHEYKAGMYPTNHTPSDGSWGYTEEMSYNKAAGVYSLSLPISSGSFAYSYQLTDKEGEVTKIDDPANPSKARLNEANSDSKTGDLVNSIVYGQFDPEKQAGSPNLDFVRPATVGKGVQKYVEYTGVLSDHQDLGIYLPAGYDADRAEPYKVVYMSHGGGGNETDWFNMGHVDNILDNLGLDYIVVTMDNASFQNASFQWDFEKIEDNVLNYIIPYMEKNYNVSAEAADRAFAGLSMGSMTTFHMFFDHPEAFAYFGAFSGTDMSAVKDTEGIDKPVFYFNVGTCDIASANVSANPEGKQIKYEDFVEYLKDHPMDNVIDGGYVKGAHDWFEWSQSFYTFVGGICWQDEKAEPGASVVADPVSPTGYTAKFVYEPEEGKEVQTVTVSGPFAYVDSAKDVKAEGNAYTPNEYKAGMFPTNHTPATGTWGASFPMVYSPVTGQYSASFPISSGSYAYSYNITYMDGTTEKIADPTRPSPALMNPDSDFATGDVNSSILYGYYDEAKQAGSPNLDYILPDDGVPKGKIEWVTYTGSWTDRQGNKQTSDKLDLGVYLPASYDPDRAEPYKVVYTSHGAGGNETDWFGMAHVDNILDNLGLDYVVVTIDNSTTGFDIDNIVENVLPVIEEKYNVSKEASGRAYNGLSAGGAMTGRMFLKYPDTFAYFGSYCGFNDITNLEAEDWPTEPKYYIATGICDPLATRTATAAGNRSGFQYDTFKENLEAKGIGDNVIDGGLIPGSHDWFVWSAAFKTFVTEVCWPDDKPVVPDYKPGATVVEDEESPTGYTARFVYAPEADGKEIESMTLSGSFNYVDPEGDVADPSSIHTPYEYKAGMYPSNYTVKTGWGTSFPMELDEDTGCWVISFPLASGAYNYSFNLTYKDGTTETIADPTNPSPALANENTTHPSGDVNSSIVYGKYDEVKQAGSPNLDFVRPSEKPAGEKGTVQYVQYEGNADEEGLQNLGVYLPAGYDAERAEPYKVVYTSHGLGGNETDWFGMAHVDNIMDNLGLDYIVVTMDNSAYEIPAIESPGKVIDTEWDYKKIEDNVVNYIIPFIEKTYNVSTDPADRAFNGLSLGGQTTCNMFLDHADKFAYFGSYCGFEDITSLDAEKWPAEATYYILSGLADPFATRDADPSINWVAFQYETFTEALEAKGIGDNVVDGGLLPGSHDWFVWSQAFYTFVTEVCWQESLNYVPGATVVEDEASPSGYTAHYVFDPTLEGEDVENIASVSLSGSFNYIDPEKDVHDADNRYTPYEYKAGMYASNRVPSTGEWGMTLPMKRNLITGNYSISMPITSGAFQYSYKIEYKDGSEAKTIDDPANPCPCLENAENSDTVSSSSANSMVIGHYDPVKQAGSPNIDYVLPVEGSTSQVVYAEYKGTIGEGQDLAIYLPSGYDAEREEPYKVIYTSHGSGGNETDWFAMGQLKNILDNIGKDYVVVTMDNSPYFDQYSADGMTRRECTELATKNTVEKILPYVEANFNVSSNPADRAFNGLSYGGRTTFTMFFDYNDQFEYFGAYSSLDKESMWDKLEEIGGWPAEKSLYFSVGPCDTDGRIEDYETLKKYVADNNVTNFIDGGLLPGSHDWLFWQQSFYDFVTEVCWQ